jgi:replicative DNA helicase
MSSTYQNKYTAAYQDLLVAAILKDPQFLVHTRDSLDRTFFTSSDNQEIMDIALKHYDKSAKTPTQTELEQALLARAVNVGWQEGSINELMNAVRSRFECDLSLVSLETIREDVSKFGRLQSLKSAIMDSIAVLEAADKGDDTANLEDVERHVRRALTVGAVKETGVSLLDFMAHPKSIIEASKYSSPERRVTTGFHYIDMVLDNGLGGGEIGFVMAPSNRGKSMVLANMAAAAFSSGKNVVYFSFEMKEPELAARITARLINQNPTQPVSPSINDIKGQSANYMNMAPDVVNYFRSINANLRIIYVKPSEATPNNLRSVLMNIQAIEGWAPDVVYVDYIDEMTLPASSKPKGDDSYSLYGQIASDLLSIAVDYSCPLWTASQVNREGYLQEPTMDTMGRSMQKADKAEFILTILQSDREKKEHKLRLKILKNRRGAGVGHRIECIEDFQRATIYETSPLV